MNVNFSNIDFHETPVILLKNYSEDTIQVLGYAHSLSMDLTYNEISQIDFILPKYVNGIKTPDYDIVNGDKIIELKDIGKFILQNPKQTISGIKTTKACKAYSLEYEFTYKTISLEQNTYNFWNPAAQDDTILYRIMEKMPSWSLGTVSVDLVDKYRTFEIHENNLYNFMKQTLQDKYGCIFEFDTFTRTVNVRTVDDVVYKKPVYLSTQNVLHDISINEDSESVKTSLNVNGAEGLWIRDINPTGTNFITNIDYYLTLDNMSQVLIDKWNAWKLEYNNYKLPYLNLKAEEEIQTARLVNEQAKLDYYNTRLDGLNSELSVLHEKKASKISGIDGQIAAKKVEISEAESIIATQNSLISQIKPIITNIISQQTTIVSLLSLDNYFTPDEYKIIDRFIKQDSIEESSFYVPSVNSYNTPGENNEFTGMNGGISGSTVTKIFNSFLQAKELYSVEGGDISLNSVEVNLASRIIRGTFERLGNNSFTLSLYLGRGNFNSTSFDYASLTLTGTATSVSDNCVPDPDAPNAYATGSLVNFYVTSGFCYFTHNVTQYERYSVQQDLFEYGESCLRKTSQPIFDFSVTSSNFLALADYRKFKDELELGEKIYLELDEDSIVTPIVTRVKVNYADKKSFVIEFSNTFTISDSEFKLMNLLDQSISMGKTLNYSQNNYSAWINSGANTNIKDFMNSNLDAAKNHIVSLTNQAQTWDSNGIWLRAYNGSGGFEPEQIKMVNNGIFFTDDAFQTVNMGIGTFYDTNLGKTTGIVAPSIVGTMIAGNNLIIESEKKDGTTAVFRVDGDGAKLYNSTFDIHNNRNTQITLNPYSGFAIGKYPLYSGTDYTINTANAQFYVDLNGNLHMKGTLDAADGTFNGVVKARDFQDLNGNSMLKNGGSGSSSGYQFTSKYLDLYGLTIRNSSTNAITFQVASNGAVTVNGAITMGAGSYINWPNVNSDPDIARLANGQYNGGTFIDGNTVYSPTIEGGTLKCSLVNGAAYGIIGFYVDNSSYPSAWMRFINSGAGIGSSNNRSLQIASSSAGDIDMQIINYSDVLLMSLYGVVRVDCYGNGRFYSEYGNLYFQAPRGQLILSAGSRVRIAAPSGTQYDFRDDGIYFNNNKIVSI